MALIHSYIRRSTLLPTIAALFILLGITWLLQSLRFLDYIINRGLDIQTFVWISLLMIPGILLFVLPVASFAGAAYGFRRMNDERETIACLSSGMSRRQIATPALSVALLAVVCGYALTLYIQPLSQRTFRDLQNDIRSGGGNLLLSEGTFNQLTPDLMVYVRERTGPSKLRGILVQDTSKRDMPVTWMAQSGTVSFSPEGKPRLILSNGVRQEVSDARSNLLSFDEHTIDMVRESRPRGARYREEDERFVPELLDLESAKSDKHARLFVAELHKRFLWPLSPIPLVLFAAVCLLKALHSRHVYVGPTAIAALFTIAYMGALIVFYNLAADGNKVALYGQWLLPLASTLICLHYMRERSLNGGRLYA